MRSRALQRDMRDVGRDKDSRREVQQLMQVQRKTQSRSFFHSHGQWIENDGACLTRDLRKCRNARAEMPTHDIKSKEAGSLKTDIISRDCAGYEGTKQAASASAMY